MVPDMNLIVNPDRTGFKVMTIIPLGFALSRLNR
jgi:hypothetical protein